VVETNTFDAFKRKIDEPVGLERSSEKLNKMSGDSCGAETPVQTR